MPPSVKRTLPLLIVLGLAALAIWMRPKPVVPPPAPAPPVSPALSVLGEIPDWSKLEAFQETITRSDFERLLTTVFVTGGAWRNFIEIDDHEARIRGSGEDIFHLRFAPPGLTKPTPRHWKTTADLPPAPEGKPLDNLHIAIDPGHIGGEWAKIEERWLLVGDGPPVREGDMTLQVANLLKPRLEALGARVSLVRAKPEPVTPLRPDSLLTLAADSADPPDSPAALRKLAERLFYRTAEIRARAKFVNDSLKPDLVLCLHFNADPWGDPANPTLVERSHLHLLLNGAYTDEEVALADQRYALLDKLLRRTHEEEALVGATVADVFAEKSGLPPFIYPVDSPNARPVNGHPYLWARNLLANRLYDCPVIFMEPYVMNSTIDLPRLQAGDYDGLREINGAPRPSIFREYADALTEGLARHHTALRPPPAGLYEALPPP
ncbi:MAG: N-acetylmuramoyl-L-alanine amidase [Luteolibacter sp.]|jgi:N-acetylmuramoyl-L-alanine amidase|nr:N-acetylmuramoyl-L-alanine amidase [Luteolibacter sp.]